jgi:putative ABC transport system substrate-binding protein
MRRREFIAGIAATATIARSARAQTTSLPTPKRIAIVDPASTAEDLTINGITAFKAYFRELHRLGYTEGRNLIVERYLEPERQAANARAVVASHPDVIVAVGGPVARQLKPLTSTIPIVAISARK